MANSISSLFNDISAKSKRDVAGIVAQAKAAPGAVVTNAKNAATAAVRGTVASAVNAGVSAVKNAAAGAVISILKGDVNGAIASIANAPAAAATGILGGVTRNINGISQSLGIGNIISGNTAGGSNALSGVTSRADPLMSIDWYCILPTVNSDYGNLQLPWNYVEESNLPMRQFDTRNVFREGRDRKFPAKYSLSDLRIACYLDSSNVSYNYFRNWNAGIVAPTTAAQATQKGGGYRLARNFQKDIFVFLVDATKNSIVSIQYIECWPTNLDTLNLDSASSTRLIQHVNFAVGDVFINTLAVNSQLISGIAANPAATLGGIVDTAKKYVGQGVDAISKAYEGIASRF